jgi:hypothetical protein
MFSTCYAQFGKRQRARTIDPRLDGPDRFKVVARESFGYAASVGLHTTVTSGPGVLLTQIDGVDVTLLFVARELPNPKNPVEATGLPNLLTP